MRGPPRAPAGAGRGPAGRTLQSKAPDQQLVLDAQVQVAGVQQLRGDLARLLVFLDQAAQRSTDANSTVSAAQISVEARRIGGSWKITSLQPR